MGRQRNLKRKIFNFDFPALKSVPYHNFKCDTFFLKYSRLYYIRRKKIYFPSSFVELTRTSYLEIYLKEILTQVRQSWYLNGDVQ